MQAPSPVARVKDLAAFIPRQAGDWKAGEADELYSRDQLYDYMDGGAEVFLDFDFREVLVRRFAGPKDNELVVDVYDMGSPEDAYGIFSCDRQGSPAGLGEESELGDGLLRVRQGRFFLTVMTMFDDQAAAGAIMEIGRALVPHMGPAGGVTPALVGALPARGLRRDRIACFHSAVNLNPRFFVSPDNILQLTTETRCVLADYDAAPGSAPAKLLLVRYPSAEKAASARASFLKGYLPAGAAAAGAGRTDKGFVATKIEGDGLAVVFEAPFDTWAADLLAGVKFPTR